MPMSAAALSVVLHEVVRRNRVRWGIVYLQISRGVSRRDHAFPPAGTAPSIVVTARNLDAASAEKMAADGVAVISVPENRWERVDIKSVSLLPNVLAKQAAREQGAREAWFVDGDGRVTEGSSSNAWIVTRDGKVVTRQADHGILKGITRTVVLDVLAAQGLKLEERAFTLDEALRRAGGLHHFGEPDRASGGEDRRPPGGQWRARADRVGAAAGLSSIRRNIVMPQGFGSTMPA